MRVVVGVLRGGPSSEYEVSLGTGAAVLGALDAEKYEPRYIFIDRAGQWHLYGAPVAPSLALRGVDVAFNALHGEFGEDGGAQRLLDALAVPYTGSGAAASAAAFNKHHTREAARQLGVKVAHGVLVDRTDDIERLAGRLFRTFPHPAVVKPAAAGSSVGVSLADSYHGLERALAVAFAVSPQVVVEEYIRGREATVGVVERFRGEGAYALLPVEIIPPPRHGFFSYEAKYGGETQELCPGSFSAKEKSELMRLARAVHEGLGLAHYSRSDFIVSKRGVYFLEVNTLPGLTEESLLPKALKAVGSSLSHFLDHILSLARGRKNV